MKNKTSASILVAFVLNLMISLAFYYKGYQQNYADLVSDQLNIIPMCLKLDNPNLYENDLFLNEVNNFKYYTPFFIEPLRFVKNLFDITYFQAINLLHTCTHLLFGLGWFLLFFFLTKNNFLVSIVVSILIRGIIWLPGMEIWGITEIWSYMPRTVYIAFMPIPFLLLFSKVKYKLIVASFLMGLIFNFHPITGLGGILIMLFSLIYFSNRKYLNSSFNQIFICIIFTLIGMLPFVMNYFLKTEVVTNYDLSLYNKAFDSRIPSYFKSSYQFFLLWFNVKTLFIIVPIILLYLLPIFTKLKFKHRNYISILCLLLFMLPLLSISVENMLNLKFDLNVRMSFQLVRIQKLAILTGHLSILYLLHQLYIYCTFLKKIVSFVLIIYMFIIPFSNTMFFNQIPFVSDDLTKMILPNFAESKSDHDLIAMGNYIKVYTPKNATFYNKTILRTIAERSVRLDHKGASILIEGNPEKLIEWYLQNKKIKTLQNKDDKFDYLTSLGINYILVDDNHDLNLKKVNAIGKYTLYEIE